MVIIYNCFWLWPLYSYYNEYYNTAVLMMWILVTLNNSFFNSVHSLRQNHSASLSKPDCFEPFPRSGKYLTGTEVTCSFCLWVCVFVSLSVHGAKRFWPLTLLWSHGSPQSNVTPSWQARLSPRSHGLLTGPNKIITLHESPDEQQIVSLNALGSWRRGVGLTDTTLNGSHQQSL